MPQVVQGRPDLLPSLDLRARRGAPISSAVRWRCCSHCCLAVSERTEPRAARGIRWPGDSYHRFVRLFTPVSAEEADRLERGVPLDGPLYWSDQPVPEEATDDAIWMVMTIPYEDLADANEQPVHPGLGYREFGSTTSDVAQLPDLGTSSVVRSPPQPGSRASSQVATPALQSGSDREFPALTGRSGTSRARRPGSPHDGGHLVALVLVTIQRLRVMTPARCLAQEGSRPA